MFIIDENDEAAVCCAAQAGVVLRCQAMLLGDDMQVAEKQYSLKSLFLIQTPGMVLTLPSTGVTSHNF